MYLVDGRILEYERARQLAPRDPDLHANLGFAGSTPDDAEGPVWSRIAFPLTGRMTTDELLLAASAAYTALMLLLIAGLLAPTVQRAARRAALVAGVALALFASSAAYRFTTVDLPARAVVTANTPVTVRFEPTATGTAHFTAQTGTVLRIVGEREGWIQVARADGARGWVEQASLARL